jgi:hypothetical protein
LISSVIESINDFNSKLFDFIENYLIQMIVIQKSGNILDMERKLYDSRRLLIDEINKADKIKLVKEKFIA